MNGLGTVFELDFQGPLKRTVESVTKLKSGKHNSEKVNEHSGSAANNINSTSSSEDVPLDCSFLDQSQHTIPAT